MVSELNATDIPRDRVDVLHILALNDDDLDQLNPEQLAAIRKIYCLDDDRTVEQRVREGSFLTDDMEDETDQINRFQRDYLP